MDLQKLMSRTRKAIDDFQMIEEGDVIAIGISGGKDSLTLLYSMAGLRRFYPKKFSLVAVTVDVGFQNQDFTGIEEICHKLDVPYHLVKTDISDIVFNERKETSPCSLCAKMRKGALNDAMQKIGCNKIAYAHHKDDIVETMLMSLIYEGRFHTFAPVTYLDRMQLKVIRPLIYLHEYEVISFTKKAEIPVLKSKCPVDGYTKREYAKQLLKTLGNENPGVKDRMFTAIMNRKLWVD